MSENQTIRCALYARVSTTEQVADPQLAELRAYCARRGWQVAGEYVDEAVSGAKVNRPALGRLLADAHRKRFDAVVVWKFDRFARSLRHLVEALDTFRSLTIDFVSLTEGVDTSTPNGRLVFAIFGAIAEFERELIRERIRLGMDAAKAKLAKGPYRRRRNGREVLVKAIGRPAKPVDPAQVRELRAQGLSLEKIACQLGVSRATIRQRLSAENKESTR